MVAQIPVQAAAKTAQVGAKTAQAGAKAGKAGVKAGQKAAQAGKKAAQAGKKTADGARRTGQAAKQTANAGRHAAHAGSRTNDALRNARRINNNRPGRNSSNRYSKIRPDLRKRLQARRRQALGQRDPEELDGAEKTARFIGRRIKRLARLDHDQKFRRRLRRLLILFAAVVALFLLPTLSLANAQQEDDPADLLALEPPPPTALSGGPIPEELIPQVAQLTGIPVDAIRAYSSAAGGDWAIDWVVMAGIGKVECDHGRNQSAGCNPIYTVWRTDEVRGGATGSGERGPMQHLGHLWRRGLNDPNAAHVEGPPTPKDKDSTYVATDGDGDGIADPWNWYDATHSTARKLTLYREELAAKSSTYDTEDFMIAAYNAGVGGATCCGGRIPNAAYVQLVKSEMTRIRTAVASLNIPAVGGGSVGGGRSAKTAGGMISIVDIATHAGTKITVAASLGPTLKSLLDAASTDGVKLTGSGFRTLESQIALRTTNGCPDVWTSPSSSCRVPTAVPGKSMHEQGLAIDFANCGYGSSCFNWLDRNAKTYGLKNLGCVTPSKCEPWHWSTNGR